MHFYRPYSPSAYVLTVIVSFMAFGQVFMTSRDSTKQIDLNAKYRVSKGATKGDKICSYYIHAWLL